jgi:amino acid transporter
MPVVVTQGPASERPRAQIESISRAGRRLGLLPLICVMYLVISGGAYGLEDAVHQAGPKLAVLLCLLVPLTLSLPTGLMAAELTALMPVEGGFYFWVKEGLGPFAGFAEAYFTILYTAVDMAIYPVLFTAYLAFLMPISPAAQAILAVSIVWLAGLLNLAGIRPVGFTSILLAVLLLSPMAALVITGLPRIVHFVAPAEPLFPPDLAGAVGAGLTVVIWNYSGWENLSVVAGELEDAGRNYLRAIGVTIPLVVAGYVLPLVVSVSGSESAAHWQMGWFSHVGYSIGGPVLGAALAVGGALMAFSVFEAAMLRLRRLRPARDGKFTVGGGRMGLYLVAGLPILTWLATFGLAMSHGDGHGDFLVAIALGVTVWPAYALARRRYGGPAKPAEERAATAET